MIVQEFLKKCKHAYSEGDFTLIQYALDYATKWHGGQLRASGEPYINHQDTRHFVKGFFEPLYKALQQL